MRNLNSLLTALVLSISTLAATGCATIGGDEVGQTEDEATSAGKLGFWNTNGSHYFHLKSGNGAVLLTSEAYTSRSGAIGGALSVLTNGVDPAQYTVNKTATGYNLRLKAANGESIAFSQVYSTKSNATRAVTSSVRAVTTYLDKREADAEANKLDVAVGESGRFHFNFVGADGRTLVMSEQYTSAAAAYNGAFAVQAEGTKATAYKLLENASGGFYFTVQALNGEVIGVSNQYASRELAAGGIAALQALLPKITVL